MNTGNTNKKQFWTHEIHENNLGPTKYLREKFWTHKYPREKILDPQNSPEKKFWTYEIPTKSRWCENNEAHDGSRPTESGILSKEE